MKDEILEQNFTAIKENFNQIDDRFDAVDKRFAQVDNRFNIIDRRFDVIEDKLNRIELVAYAILEIIKGHDSKFLNMEKRLFGLEKRVV